MQLFERTIMKSQHNLLALILTALFVTACNNQVGSSNTSTNTNNSYIANNSTTQTLVPLGATVSEDASGNYTTSFAIWSPDTANVQLWLGGSTPTTYNLSSQEQYLSSDSSSTVYYVTLPGDLSGTPYHFIVNGNNVHDPYAKMTDLNWQETGYENNDIVINTQNIHPASYFTSYASSPNKTDTTAYELSVRDYTIDSSSGVSPQYRGTFSGLTQSGTSYNGMSTGFDHIKQLGVSHVQIMPMFEYGSCSIDDLMASSSPSDQSNWGYDPVNYNVPEWRYSKYNTYQYTNGAMLPDPNNLNYNGRIMEAQEMVNNFHNAGIGVIMDVVYNHTYSKSVLGNITNSYYTATDLSGVGNSLDVSNPMVSQMVLDSLRYWIQTYHIDGFRFDLMGVYPYAVVKSWATELNSEFPDRHLIFYGEPWNGGQTDSNEANKIRLGTVSLTENTVGVAQVGVFNPSFRDALHGDSSSSANGGYIFNQTSSTYFAMTPITQGSQGAIRYSSNETNPIAALSNLWDPMFAYEPAEDINYVSCHDNLTLWDKIKVWAYANSANNTSLGYLQRIDKFAMGIILTSQGIPFIQGGDEFLRSKPTTSTTDVATGVDDNDNSGSNVSYSHNSYDLPDETNSIKWANLANYAPINQYYQSLITLRNNHPAFKMTSWSNINSYATTSSPEAGVLVTQINGAAVGDSWNNIIVIYNSQPDYTYLLPNGNWNLVLNDGNPVASNPTIVSGSVVAKGTAVTILYQ